MSDTQQPEFPTISLRRLLEFVDEVDVYDSPRRSINAARRTWHDELKGRANSRSELTIAGVALVLHRVAAINNATLDPDEQHAINEIWRQVIRKLNNE